MEKVKEWIKIETGSGSGYGSGDGPRFINGEEVYLIDNTPTIITNIKLNLAKGFILNSDLTLTPCFIVKGHGYFAHGETVKDAHKALQEKIFENMDSDEAIEKFTETFKDGERYPGKVFFEWHHYLTGSCEMGRKSFVENRGLSLEATYTIHEFISICEDSYGGEIIKQLKERLEREREGKNFRENMD